MVILSSQGVKLGLQPIQILQYERLSRMDWQLDLTMSRILYLMMEAMDIYGMVTVSIVWEIRNQSILNNLSFSKRNRDIPLIERFTSSILFKSDLYSVAYSPSVINML